METSPKTGIEDEDDIYGRARRTSTMALAGLREKLWPMFVLQIVLPIMPVLIQYALWICHVYEVEKFPQEAFLLSIFAVALAVFLERGNSSFYVLFLCIFPTIAAALLYVLYLIFSPNGIQKMTEDQESSSTLKNYAAIDHTVLKFGFYTWLIVVIIYFLLVLIEYSFRKTPEAAEEGAT